MVDATKAFRREIDLGDGSGVQVFEGDTAEEVMDALAEAQRNATRKIRELNQEKQDLSRRVLSQPQHGQEDPDGPLPEFKPRILTADERFALGQRLQNPATAADAIQEAIEAGFGATAEQIRRALLRAEITPRQLRGKEAAEQFLLNHPEFVPNAKNQQAIFGYMQHPDRKMALTVENFEIAFGACSTAGLLELRTPAASGTNGNGTHTNGRAADSAQPGNGESTPRFASTSIATRGSGTPRVTPGPKMPSADEIDRMPSAEYRRRYNDPQTGAAFRAHVEKIETARAQRAGR